MVLRTNKHTYFKNNNLIFPQKHLFLQLLMYCKYIIFSLYPRLQALPQASVETKRFLNSFQKFV